METTCECRAVYVGSWCLSSFSSSLLQYHCLKVYVFWLCSMLRTPVARKSVPQTEEIGLKIITTAKMVNKVSQESSYISNTFSRESSQFQTVFHVSKRSPCHFKRTPGKPANLEIQRVDEGGVVIWWKFCWYFFCPRGKRRGFSPGVTSCHSQSARVRTICFFSDNYFLILFFKFVRQIFLFFQ